MSSNRSNIELIANFILNELSKTPSKTLKELHTLLQQNEKIPVVSLQILGKYLHVLHKQGYVKRTITRPHRYRLGNTTPPFKVIVRVRKPKIQKELQKPVRTPKIHEKKQKSITIKKRQSVGIDIYRESRKKEVEKKANFILSTIHKHPDKTTKELIELLHKNTMFCKLQRPMIRQYLLALCKHGYIIDLYSPHKYRIVGDKPFKYIPVTWYKKGQT